MGFQLPRTEYDLPFDDTPLAGLKIRVRAMTMGERMRVFFDLGYNPDDAPEDTKVKQDERNALFIEHLVEWNIEDPSGAAIPLTMEDLHKVAEPEQIGTILGVWSSGRTSVPAPWNSHLPVPRCRKSR